MKSNGACKAWRVVAPPARKASDGTSPSWTALDRREPTVLGGPGVAGQYATVTRIEPFESSSTRRAKRAAISAVGVPSRPTTASLSATPELPPDFPGGLAQAAVPRASAASTAAAPIRRLDLICSPQSWFLQIVADEGSVLTTVAQPGSAANNRSMNERVTPAIGSAVVAMVGLAAVIGSGALVDRERGSSASYA